MNIIFRIIFVFMMLGVSGPVIASPKRIKGILVKKSIKHERVYMYKCKTRGQGSYYLTTRNGRYDKYDKSCNFIQQFKRFHFIATIIKTKKGLVAVRLGDCRYSSPLDNYLKTISKRLRKGRKVIVSFKKIEGAICPVWIKIGKTKFPK